MTHSLIAQRLTMATAAVGTGAYFAALFLLLLGISSAYAQTSAIREIDYDPRKVIEVEVARGVAVLLMLPDGEQISYAATGLGADCRKPDDVWCIQPYAETNVLFAKAKSRASRFNNIEVVTRSRTYSFRLVVASDEKAGTQRLVVRAPARGPSSPMLGSAAAGLPLPASDIARGAAPDLPARAVVTTPPRDPRDVVADRLAQPPALVNSSYSLALGDRSDDIVPTGAWDDGRFTYLRFPGNREIPSVFHVTADGEETMTNTRMDGDLLVVDRVSRLMRLRLGSQVVSVINEAFDIEGRPPAGGTTAPGVERVMRAANTNPR